MSRCDLYLENYDGKYLAGQTAVGSLQCVFTDEKIVKGLTVTFKGVAKVQWSESESKTDSNGKSYTDTTWYTAEQSLVSHKINLLPSGIKVVIKGEARSSWSESEENFTPGRKKSIFRQVIYRSEEKYFEHEIDMLSESIKVSFNGEVRTHWSESERHYDATRKEHVSRRVDYYGNKTVCNIELTLLSGWIEVVLKGQANTKWHESHRSYNAATKKHVTRTVRYSAHSIIFELRTNLLGSHGSEVTIPAGIHKYPFTYTLPTGIPSSYHDDIGEVVYTVKGVVNRPFLKFDYEAKSEIKIVSPLNLNLNRSLLNPVHREDEKNVCCWCCSSGPVSYVWRLPCTGFTPGQTIPINLRIENLSNDNVESVDFRIKKKTTYKSTTPSHKEKDSSQTIAEISFTGVGAHGERDYNEVFRIPANLHVPNLENCDIINTYYKLEVMEISLPCFSFNMEEDVRIALGHIPLEGVNLQQNGNPPDYASIQPVENFQPVAPPMEAVGPSAPPPPGGGGWVVPGTKIDTGNEAPPNYDEAIGFKT